MAAPKTTAAAPKKTPATAGAAKELVLLRALEPINADGEQYQPGDEFEIRAAVALPLIESRAAERVNNEG